MSIATERRVWCRRARRAAGCGGVGSGRRFRGRSERWFGTVQGRPPRKLAHEGIAEMEVANGHLREPFWPRMNRRFGVEARE